MKEDKIVQLALNSIYQQLIDYLFANSFYLEKEDGEFVRASEMQEKINELFEGVAYGVKKR